MHRIRYLAGVVTLHLDEEKCNGCGTCHVVCPRAVFAVTEGKARIVDRDACIECGACALNCSPGAVSVHAGVGCASAIIRGWLTGSEPNCDCGRTQLLDAGGATTVSDMPIRPPDREQRGTARSVHSEGRELKPAARHSAYRNPNSGGNAITTRAAHTAYTGR